MCVVSFGWLRADPIPPMVGSSQLYMCKSDFCLSFQKTYLADNIQLELILRSNSTFPEEGLANQLVVPDKD
jgi:hypothetical protein